MEKSKKNRLGILKFCGACISFYIGAGFATMQEVSQYEASYGSEFLLVIFVAAAIYIYTNISFATNGNRLALKSGGDIYGVYCSIFGKHIGRILACLFNYFSVIFCYMSFIVMCGGANSTLTQQWGIQSGIGAATLAVFAVTTVILGLHGVVSSLSKIGPIIIVSIFIIAIVSAIAGWDSLSENLTNIDSGDYVGIMKQIGDGNPWSSGASYGGFVILWFASFLSEIGAKNNIKQVNLGMLCSAIFIFGTSIICCIAIIGQIDSVADSDIPALILAAKISPFMSWLFAIIIYAGIYTSAVPLLWTAVRKIAQEKSPQYIVATITLGGIGCVIACFAPYKGLINTLYGVNGYLGFALVFIMVIYDLKTNMSNKIGEKHEFTDINR